MTDAEEAAYLAGATWGINAGRRALADQIHTNDQRDEWIARMIVAHLLQHETQPLTVDIESHIDRLVRMAAEMHDRVAATGPMPTYAECMASWGEPA